MKSTSGFNRKKIALIHLLLIFIILISGSQVSAAEWTAEQKEAWAVIQAAWKKLKEGDVQSVMAGRHDSCLSLFSDNPTPFNNEQIQKIYKNWMAGDHKPTFFRVDPIEILIVDNVAIIFYLYKWKSHIGSKQSGRTMSALKKQKNNKWVLIGGMSASCDKLVPCPYGW